MSIDERWPFSPSVLDGRFQCDTKRKERSMENLAGRNGMTGKSISDSWQMLHSVRILAHRIPHVYRGILIIRSRHASVPIRGELSRGKNQPLSYRWMHMACLCSSADGNIVVHKHCSLHAVAEVNNDDSPDDQCIRRTPPLQRHRSSRVARSSRGLSCNGEPK